MKKNLVSLIIAAMLMTVIFPAFAEGKDCWYLSQYGDHDFEQTDAGYASCEEDGYYVLECRQCGLYRRETTQKPTGHKWKESYREEPTDYSAGIIVQVCSNCGESRKNTFYPDGTLYRGTKDSDGVMELQLMLIDCGYLNDSMDGKFGKNTEAAVKAFQKDANLRVDGIAWPQTMEYLEKEWNQRQNYYSPDPDVITGMQETETPYAPFCYSWEDANGTMVTQQCEKHALLWEAALNMLADDYADSALYSYYEWQAEIISLYNIWSDLVDGEARERVESSKALCLAMMDAQMSAMRESYDLIESEILPGDVYYGAELWMRSHAMWLCQMLSTLGAES